MSEKQLIALVYRVGKGCRQYPFFEVEELRVWAARHPYRHETLTVMAVGVDGRLCGAEKVTANEAADVVLRAGVCHG